MWDPLAHHFNFYGLIPCPVPLVVRSKGESGMLQNTMNLEIHTAFTCLSSPLYTHCTFLRRGLL